MKKIFYEHLVNIEEVTVELDSFQIDSDEKEELVSIIDQTLHHSILESILDNLPKELHKNFLSHFYRDPHDPELLIFIKENVTVDIEFMIKKKAGETKKEILTEIKKSLLKRNIKY